jgi:hypothetical protein
VPDVGGVAVGEDNGVAVEIGFGIGEAVEVAVAAWAPVGGDVG